ncbi:hypothetical protein ACJRO7_001963 [Eucalyptus globulus]|uniref:Uncharacterized protein n=1 Tax=Eucalyptus globulus TaxID=34317 RepID=A0ABD3LSP4_EUCGL
MSSEDGPTPAGPPDYTSPIPARQPPNTIPPVTEIPGDGPNASIARSTQFTWGMRIGCCTGSWRRSYGPIFALNGRCIGRSSSASAQPKNVRGFLRVHRSSCDLTARVLLQT